MDDDIKCLVIESDEKDTNGWFLFFHKLLDTPCETDLWFKTIKEAKAQGAFNYAISEDEWIILEPYRYL